MFRHAMMIALLGPALIVGHVPVLGAPAPLACPAEPVLPPDLADWAKAGSGETIFAYDAGRVGEWPLLGNARTALSLHTAQKLRYAIAPERAPADGKFGGMVPIAMEKPGRLVVALDAGAWIDLVRDGVVVASVGHGHGPACSGIRKMVEFDVTPGRYLLQIINAPEASIRAMAVLRD